MLRVLDSLQTPCNLKSVCSTVQQPLTYQFEAHRKQICFSDSRFDVHHRGTSAPPASSRTSTNSSTQAAKPCWKSQDAKVCDDPTLLLRVRVKLFARLTLVEKLPCQAAIALKPKSLEFQTLGIKSGHKNTVAKEIENVGYGVRLVETERKLKDKTRRTPLTEKCQERLGHLHCGRRAEG